MTTFLEQWYLFIYTKNHKSKSLIFERWYRGLLLNRRQLLTPRRTWKIHFVAFQAESAIGWSWKLMFEQYFLKILTSIVLWLFRNSVDRGELFKVRHIALLLGLSGRLAIFFFISLHYNSYDFSSIRLASLWMLKIDDFYVLFLVRFLENLNSWMHTLL